MARLPTRRYYVVAEVGETPDAAERWHVYVGDPVYDAEGRLLYPAGLLCRSTVFAISSSEPDPGGWESVPKALRHVGCDLRFEEARPYLVGY